MNAIPRHPAIVAATLLLLAAYACSDDNSTGLGASASVVVTGIVVAVEDMVPVDGGVIIDLACLSGRSERLMFPSLFTNPPPSEEKLQLYQVILQVKSGSLVRAGGTRIEDGIELERLTILHK